MTSKEIMTKRMSERRDLEDERSLNKDEVVGALRSAQLAGVEFVSGLADAFARGWKSFRDEIEESTRSQNAGVISGSFEATASFFEGLAGATRRSYDQLRSRRVARTPAPLPAAIDYERLAKLVAAELRPDAKSPLIREPSAGDAGSKGSGV